MKVVIIGGGPSAKHAAEDIKKKVKKGSADITVVQAHNYVEWPLAMPSVFCKPTDHNRALSANPSKYQIPGVKYVYGPATAVDPKAKAVTVETEGGPQSVPFDALVVCTGFHLPVFTPTPGQKLADRKAEVLKISTAIAEAATVAVMGGGPVGIETAGLIKHTYPTKKVILACRDGLMKGSREQRQQKIQEVLKSRGIEVMTGAGDAPADLSLEKGTFKANGASVDFDVFIPAYSRGPNTKFLAGTDVIDERGFVKVNEFLQSTACPDIFTVGVADLKEGVVTFAKLQGQWQTVANNVAAHLQSKPMKPHKEGAPFMKNPPLLIVAGGKGGWAGWDCQEMPGPVRACCCNGKCGFPCCPCFCCWCCPGPCGPCCCGTCGGAPEGEGPAKALGSMPFKSFTFHFKGIGDVPEEQVPGQQTMIGK